MSDNKAANTTRPTVTRLRRARLGTWMAVYVERLWPLLLPVVVVAGLFVSASWFGLFRFVPDAVRIVLVGLFAIAALAALYPLRHFRRPRAAEIDRRIERANALPHRPCHRAFSSSSIWPGPTRCWMASRSTRPA